MLFCALALFTAGGGAGRAVAQELLSNPSFENPVMPSQGNNLNTTIPDWSIANVSPPQAQPFNIIRPWSGYANNPTATPVDGGAQYLDVNSAQGLISQTVIVPSQGMVDIGGWFSVRDNVQDLSGLIIRLRDSNGTIIASATTSFTAAEPIGLWKHVAVDNIPVAAGTYTYEAFIPNPSNFDLATVFFRPAPTFTKTSAAVSDPVNGTTNPKLIPGGVAEYTLSVTVPSSYGLSNNSVELADATPAGAELVVADIGGGSGPVSFTPGGSTLMYSYAGLGSTTDNIDFSNDGGSSWTYTPTPDAAGADASVTNIRVRPQGAMAAGSSVSLHVRYRVK